jgi:hypothetical protein
MAVVVRALREKLGDEAMGGLQTFVDGAGRKWKEEMFTIAAERFDHRLGAEIGALRLDMAKEFATVRVETAREFAAVRNEMAREFAAVRGEAAKEFAAVRTEMTALGAGLRTEMAETRFHMLKWAFVFWVGQLVAMTGIMALLLRAMLPR